MVTKCCEVKEVKVVKAAKEAKEAKEEGAAVATKGGVAANNGGIAASQELKQSNDANVKIDGDNNVVTIDQTNEAYQTQAIVPIKINIEDITINPNIAWNGGQAGNDNIKDSYNTEEII